MTTDQVFIQGRAAGEYVAKGDPERLRAKAIALLTDRRTKVAQITTIIREEGTFALHVELR